MRPPIHQQLADIVKAYQMPAPAKALLKRPELVILCGITAAGKDTLMRELVAGGGYKHVVSHTTRKSRVNQGTAEQEGQDYYFVSEDRMLAMAKQQAFVEVKSVHDKYFYGTSIAALADAQKNGNIPVLEIDVQGAEEFIKAVPGLRPIFLLPPSFAVWQERLKGRGSLGKEELTGRMNSAVMEIQTIMDNPSFQLLINTDKAQTAKSIKNKMAGREQEALNITKQLIADIKSWLLKNGPKTKNPRPEKD